MADSRGSRLLSPQHAAFRSGNTAGLVTTKDQPVPWCQESKRQYCKKKLSGHFSNSREAQCMTIYLALVTNAFSDNFNIFLSQGVVSKKALPSGYKDCHSVALASVAGHAVHQIHHFLVSVQTLPYPRVLLAYSLCITESSSRRSCSLDSTQ